MRTRDHCFCYTTEPAPPPSGPLSPLTLAWVVRPKIKPTGEPTQADIDKYHALFVTELRRIFDKYKGSYGWGDKELIIS